VDGLASWLGRSWRATSIAALRLRRRRNGRAIDDNEQHAEQEKLHGYGCCGSRWVGELRERCAKNSMAFDPILIRWRHDLL
jgi:hypothetical protein